jgi:hypothetical protein
MKGECYMPNNNISSNDSGCVTFKLPDGDRTLVSWEFVSGKLQEAILPITNALIQENQSLDQIISRIDEWLEEQSG